MGACERACAMSQLSKVNHSRHQWKGKATQRGDDNRYLRKQLARVKAERDQAKQALQESHPRLRQLESQVQAVAVQSKVDGVDRKSTRLNSSHGYISYAVFCLK